MLNEKDLNRLKNILIYCDRIDKTLIRMNNDYETFSNDLDFQQSISFSIAQIGELAFHCRF